MSLYGPTPAPTNPNAVTPAVPQVQDINDITIQCNETLLQVLSEMRCIRLALTKIACEGNQAKPQDFDPKFLTTDPEIADQQQI
jgi:hypothetical protein